MKKLIGIVGTKGVGKTLAAQYIGNNTNTSSRIIPFSEPLKKEVHDLLTNTLTKHGMRMLGISHRVLYGTQEEKESEFQLSLDDFAFATAKGFSLKNLGIIHERSRLVTTSGRKLLQWYGTDYRRVQNPDYWLSAWVDMALKCPEQLVICDDVRFENEASLIKLIGGYLIKINRDGSIDQHPSESGVKHIWTNYTIDNNHSIEDLHFNLDIITSYLESINYGQFNP